MPRRDGTGPMGMGSMTGRGAGVCTGFAAPDYMNSGIGYGMGYGRGRGFRRMLCCTDVPAWNCSGYTAYGRAVKPAADEKEYLNNRAELLENQLHQIKKRLQEINGGNE